MQFEWDSKKNELTKQDRGISFEDAVQLWYAESSIEVPAKTEGEIRLAKIGVLFGKVHVCIFTTEKKKFESSVYEELIQMRRKNMKKQKLIKTDEFDQKFEVEDVSEDLDWGQATKRVNVDFPIWMVDALDKEASRLQVPRQSVIKMWIDWRLQEQEHRKLAV